MNPWARLDWMAAELGLLHFGGALAFYDQTRPERVEALASAIVRNDLAAVSIAPTSYPDMVRLWNDTRPQKAGKDDGAADAMIAQMEGG